MPVGAASPKARARIQDRKSTRLNSSHSQISYAVFCLKKKKKKQRSLHIHAIDKYTLPRIICRRASTPCHATQYVICLADILYSRTEVHACRDRSNTQP